MKEIDVAGAIILKINEKEKIREVLLIQRSASDSWRFTWEIPRGKCSKDEKILECLKREVKEETGLNIVPMKFIDKYEYIADRGTRKSTQYNFLCVLDPPNQKVKLSFEHMKFRWVSAVGEIELLVPPEMKKSISKVLNPEEKIVNYDKQNEPKDEVNSTQTKIRENIKLDIYLEYLND